MLFTIIGMIGGITLLDLILSGDNALVVGAVAARLQQRRQRLLAITIGGGAAILCRILFTIIAALLLQAPFLEATGAVIIFIVALRLLMQSGEDEEPSSDREALQRRFLTVIVSILIADLSMSLDNILAIGALAAGNIGIIIFGLTLSVAILMVASALVAELVRRLPWLIDLAAFILAWTAASMLISDKFFGPLLTGLLSTQAPLPFLQVSWMAILLDMVAVAGMVGLDLLFRSRRKAPPASISAEKV